MAIHVVHDRGRGYSNSFTLCRGGTLSPQHSIHPSGTALNNHTEYADNQPKPFNYIPQYRHLPYELGPPVMTNRQSGTAQVFSSHPDISYHLLREAAFGITPMALVQREPILRYINFQLSPTQNQVLWLYGKIGMVSHPNPTISFCPSSPFHLGHIHLQKFHQKELILLRFSQSKTQVFPSRVIKLIFSTSNQ